MIPRKHFGATSLNVSTLGLGGAWIGVTDGSVSDRQALRTVYAAIEAGIDYIDTSPLYGASEQRIGRALRDGLRQKVVLATKTGTRRERPYDYSGDATRWSVEKSLKALGTDHLDVVLIHDPKNAESFFAQGAALDTLESMRASGWLRYIGIGVRDLEILAECIRSDRFDVILTFMECNLISQRAQDTLLDLAKKRGIAVINGSPLHMGLLANVNRPASDSSASKRWPQEDLLRAEKLRSWSAAQGIDLVALALQYSMAQEGVALTLNGARSPQEVAHSISCATRALPEDVWIKLEQDLGIPSPHTATRSALKKAGR